MNDAIFALSDICCRYSSGTVLHDVSISIPRGKLTALVGPNGSGKSTLLRCLARLLAPYRGSALMDGADIYRCSPRAFAREVAYLPQNQPLPELPVRELVAMGRTPFMTFPYKLSGGELAIIDSAMCKAGCADFADRRCSRLSGGERQRVRLAMLLAQLSGASVALMDEPASGLDISRRQALLSLARELCGNGKTVVMALHELDDALNAADSLVLMEHGRVAGFGTSGDVLQSGKLQRVFGVDIEEISVRNEKRHLFFAGETTNKGNE